MRDRLLKGIEQLGRKVLGGTMAFRKLYNLSIDDHFLDDIEREMVWRASRDLENAANCLKTSGDTQTAVFNTHAAAEKFLKVALRRSGSKRDPKSFVHNIPNAFAELIKMEPRYAWLQSSIDALHAFVPNMEIRYRIVPRTVENAVSAFLAALNVCGTLSQIWMFDAARGSKRSPFVPGRFYVDGEDRTYYCKEIRNTSRPLAVLNLFQYEPSLGWSILMDVRLELNVSALYLEVTDSDKIAVLRQRYETQLRNPGRRVSPEQLGIEIASGPEGSYTTSSFRVERSKIKV